MSGPTLTLEPVGDDELGYVERLLERSDLPADDVREKPDCFYVGLDGSERVGVGGVEAYGSDGLLRSVVVDPAVRGQGYGTVLCDQLEARAADDGIETLYLLTTTAADFFGDRGYEPIDRTATPAAIRSTTEFSDLCPDSATCLRTRL